MRIAIFGVGGVGGYFGWRLAQVDSDVTFIARGETFEALSKNGLRMDTPDGKSVVQPVQVSDNPQRVGPVDAVIIGVKAWQVPEVAETIRPLVGVETFVVPLQNGLEAPSHLSKGPWTGTCIWWLVPHSRHESWTWAHKTCWSRTICRFW